MDDDDTASVADSWTTVNPAGGDFARIRELGAALRPAVAAAKRLSSSREEVAPDDSISMVGMYANHRVLSSLSKEDVSQLLVGLELGRYAAEFSKFPVRGADLEHATEDDLREAGMSLGLHRRALLRQVAAFKVDGVPPHLLQVAAGASRLTPAVPQGRGASSDARSFVEGGLSAEELSKRGHQANGEGDVAAARAHFLAAFELEGSPKAQLSAANMALKLGESDVALREYEALLQRPDLAPEHRQAVHTKIGVAMRMQATLHALQVASDMPAVQLDILTLRNALEAASAAGVARRDLEPAQRSLEQAEQAARARRDALRELNAALPSWFGGPASAARLRRALEGAVQAGVEAEVLRAAEGKLKTLEAKEARAAEEARRREAEAEAAREAAERRRQADEASLRREAEERRAREAAEEARREAEAQAWREYDERRQRDEAAAAAAGRAFAATRLQASARGSAARRKSAAERDERAAAAARTVTRAAAAAAWRRRGVGALAAAPVLLGCAAALTTSGDSRKWALTNEMAALVSHTVIHVCGAFSGVLLRFMSGIHL